MGSCCVSAGKCHRSLCPLMCKGRQFPALAWASELHEQLELSSPSYWNWMDSLTGWTQWEKYGEWCGEVDSNYQTSFHFSTAFGVTVLFSIVAFQFEEEFIETKEDLEKLRSGESVNCSLNIDSQKCNKRTTGGIFLKICNMMWPVKKSCLLVDAFIPENGKCLGLIPGLFLIFSVVLQQSE